METELAALEKALGNPEHPVAAVVGGAKVSTKLDVLKHLVSKFDHLIIGGGMANTFLASRGVNVGKRLCEHDLTATAEAIFDAADDAGCIVHLPRLEEHTSELQSLMRLSYNVLCMKKKRYIHYNYLY